MNSESDLAKRVRAALKGVETVREVKMFGGIGFMVNGNLVCAASRRGLLLRVGSERQSEALARPGIRPMEMRGRLMKGYVYADPPPRSDDAIDALLQLAPAQCSNAAAEAGRGETQADERTNEMTLLVAGRSASPAVNP